MLKEIDLHITNACDNKCIFCSFNSGVKLKNELSLEEIYDILRQAEEMKVEDIHITGGEPTMRKELLFDILKFAQENFSGEVRLISNANNLSYKYLFELRQRGLKNIMLSIDGNKAVHDNFRVRDGSYECVMQAAKNAIALGMTVRFSLVACKLNLHTIKDEILHATDLGVKIFSIFLLSPVGRGKSLSQYVLTPEEWITFCDSLRNWYKEKQLSDKINLVVEKGYQDKRQPVNVEQMHGRGAGCSRIGSNREYIMIDAVGNIFPCICFVNTDHSIGNIRNGKLKDIIDDDNKWLYYTSLQTKKYEKCDSCDVRSVCKGGCKGLTESGFSQKCSVGYYQVCPLMKESYKNDKIGGSSEEVM